MRLLRGVSLLFVILLVVSSTGLVAPIGPSAAELDHSDADADAVAQTTTNTSTPTNSSNASTSTLTSAATNSSNSTVRHLGPELPQTDAEYDIVLSQLETQLAARLVASSEAVEAREFDAAEVQLAGNTTELLRQYQRVAANSPTDGDDVTAADFNFTVEQQRDLIDSARNARRTYNQYQLAKARGNETRARQLARDLLNESATGNQTASELIERYERLENTTDINASTITTGVRNAQTRLEELERVVRDENFVTPTLTITDTPERASPVDPLVVEGRVTANDTGVANGTIALTVGDQTVRTQTDAGGNFTVALRPTTLAVGSQPAQIRYVPDPTSPYESIRTSFNVTIESAAPTVTTQLNRSRVQFQDPVSLRGRVTVNGTQLPDVTVEARINGQLLDRTRTTAEGRFDLSALLAATVPPGDQRLTLVVSSDGRAVEPVREPRQLTVVPTPTDLQLRVQQLNRTTLRLTGTLQTSAGTPLSGRRVSLTPGASDSRAVQTDRDGRFNTTVSIPASAGRGEIPFTARDVSIDAAFNGSGENVDSETTTATISYTPPAAQSARNVLLGTFAVGVALGGAVFWQRRRTETFQSPTDPTGATIGPEDTVETLQSGFTATALLERAETAAEAGDSTRAIQLGYAALRRAYVAEYDLSPALTHWELVGELHGTLSKSEQKTLSEATTVYEQVVYTTGADVVSDDAVRSLLTSVEWVVTDSG